MKHQLLYEYCTNKNKIFSQELVEMPNDLYFLINKEYDSLVENKTFTKHIQELYNNMIDKKCKIATMSFIEDDYLTIIIRVQKKLFNKFILSINEVEPKKYMISQLNE